MLNLLRSLSGAQLPDQLYFLEVLLVYTFSFFLVVMIFKTITFWRR